MLDLAGFVAGVLLGLLTTFATGYRMGWRAGLQRSGVISLRDCLAGWDGSPPKRAGARGDWESR